MSPLLGYLYPLSITTDHKNQNKTKQTSCHPCHAHKPVFGVNATTGMQELRW